MDALAAWLASNGLGHYAETFARHEIDLDILPDLTEEDLAEIGLPIGARRRVRVALSRTPKDAQTSPHPTQAERRQLTIVFAELTGQATPTSDEAEQRRLINLRFQRGASNAVERYGGYVARFMGDGILAYFGYPTAHEDAAERAVRAGLALVEHVLRSEGDTLGVRVGIATGPVVVGEIVGAGAAEEHTVVGETPNLAARLRSLAAPNSVVVSGGTRRLLGERFELDALGGHAIRGFPGLISLFEVRKLREISRFAAAVQPDTVGPMVGREPETDVLLSAWQAACSGHGRAVIVSGEPGIGKSRLVDSFASQIAPVGLMRLQCSPYHTTSAYRPVIEQVERGAGFAPADSADARLEKLVDFMRWDAVGDHEHALRLGRMATLLGLAGASDYQKQDTATERAALIQLIIERIAAEAAQAPFLIVVEDVHWMDPSTLSVLDALVAAMETLRITLVMTARPASSTGDAPVAASSDIHRRWEPSEHVHAVTLKRLATPDARRLVRTVLSGKRLPQSVVQRILAKADGVPLFLQELAKSVASATTPGQRGIQVTIPDTLQDSLMARLDRLGPAREVAQHAAVIGREFSVDLLRAATPSGQRDQMLFALATLEQAGVVTRAPGGEVYRFQHALVQDAAYSSLLQRRRVRLHGQLADHLVRTGHTIVRTQPEILARHYDHAGRPGEALAQWQRAAKGAVERFAYAETIAHIDQALTASERVSVPASDLLKLHTERAHALLAVQGQSHPETGAAYAAARELAATQGDPRDVLPILRGLFNYHLGRGALKSASGSAEEMLALATAYQDRTAKSFAHAFLGMSHGMEGRLAIARHHAETGLELYDVNDRDRSAVLYGHDSRVASLQWIALTATLLGDTLAGADAAERGCRYADEVGIAYSQGLARAFAARTYALQGDWRRVAEHARVLLTLSRSAALAPLVGLAQLYLVVCQWELQRDAAHIERLPTVGVSLRWLATHTASVYIDAGREDAAHRVIQGALEDAQRSGMRFQDPELFRLRGILARRAGAREEAAADFERAVRLARQTGAVLYELRAAVDFGRSLLARGENERAKACVQKPLTKLRSAPELLDATRARTFLSEA